MYFVNTFCRSCLNRSKEKLRLSDGRGNQGGCSDTNDPDYCENRIWPMCAMPRIQQPINTRVHINRCYYSGSSQRHRSGAVRLQCCQRACLRRHCGAREHCRGASIIWCEGTRSANCGFALKKCVFCVAVCDWGSSTSSSSP